MYKVSALWRKCKVEYLKRIQDVGEEVEIPQSNQQQQCQQFNKGSHSRHTV